MFSTILEIPFLMAEKYPDRVSHRSREEGQFVDVLYKDFVKDIRYLSEGFSSWGMKKGDHVSFFVNNRYEWILSDFAFMNLSAVSVPRGSDTAPLEAAFIFNHSDSSWLVVENLDQLKELMPVSDVFKEKSKKIFVVDKKGDIPDGLEGLIVFYEDVIKRGKELLAENPHNFEKRSREVNTEDLMTIIYTSGTTGNPKGVMLSQRHFLENISMTVPRLKSDETAGEVTVTILPAWHVFERAFEYTCLSTGFSFVYSSLKYFASDIVREKPHVLASVPRMWESIFSKMNNFMKGQSVIKRSLFYFMVHVNSDYKRKKSYLKRSYVRFRKEALYKKIFRSAGCVAALVLSWPLHILAELMFRGVRAKVGGRLRCAISGGGALPVAIDKFFSSVGICLVNAYGMTECAPGIMSREIHRNPLGAVGIPFGDTQVRLLNNSKEECAPGEKGTLFVKGRQVMIGYYKNPEATKAILSEDGWLNTGDLAKVSQYGDYILVGRNKDTIVLLGGENVEPLPIEDKIKENELIDHAMLLGQDKKGLTAFIALNDDELKKYLEKVKIRVQDFFAMFSEDQRHLKSQSVTEGYRKLQELIKRDLDKKISRDQGFKPFEKITSVILVKNNFKVGEELTQTLKIKRKKIEEKYREVITFFMKTAR